MSDHALTFAQVFGVRARAGVAAVAVMALSMALMIGVVAPASAGAPQAETAKLREPSVIIVGVPGLRWTDVDAQRTPYLWELSEVSTLGQMSTRSARSRTCPADGWVQLGTGNRARFPMSASGSRPSIFAAGRSLGGTKILHKT